jgi:hypothetical protein
MEPYEITIRYRRRSGPEKSIKASTTAYPIAYLIDTFVLESVMKEEEPDLLSIHPLVQSVPRGQPARPMPTNQELLRIHSIDALTFEIDGRFFSIST